jgi:hypothetical protein
MQCWGPFRDNLNVSVIVGMRLYKSRQDIGYLSVTMAARGWTLECWWCCSRLCGAAKGERNIGSDEYEASLVRGLWPLHAALNQFAIVSNPDTELKVSASLFLKMGLWASIKSNCGCQTTK